ncbi:hypothetical protein M5G07_10695 [Serratia symbiotica]|nr:hypothetical protein [Serratia symbiotica]
MAELIIEVPVTLWRALERMVRSLENRQPLMQAISEDMLSAVMENFEQESCPSGSLSSWREEEITYQLLCDALVSEDYQALLTAQQEAKKSSAH